MSDTTTDHTRAVLDRARAETEAAGAEPRLVDDLPRPLLVSDLHELATRLGYSVSRFFDV